MASKLSAESADGFLLQAKNLAVQLQTFLRALGTVGMQHDPFKSSDKTRWIGIDSCSQNRTSITLQQFLSLLRQHKVDEKLGRIGMRSACP